MLSPQIPTQSFSWCAFSLTSAGNVRVLRRTSRDIKTTLVLVIRFVGYRVDGVEVDGFSGDGLVTVRS